MYRPDLYEIKNMMMEMSELGAAQLAKRLSPANDNMSQREAYRHFGEARVKNWLEHNMIHRVRSGTEVRSKILYSYAELLSADRAEKFNRILNG